MPNYNSTARVPFAKGGKVGRAALGGTEDRPGRHPPVKKEKTRKGLARGLKLLY